MAIAVFTIGIFALPGTVSLFAGQHVWYDLSEGVNEVPCEKCHADVAEEMQSEANGAHRSLTCAMCHRTGFNNYTYGSGEGGASTPGEEAHAAAVIECMDCHGVDETGQYNHGSWPEYSETGDTCYKCHIDGNYFGDDDFIAAGGFNLTGRSWDTGENAAHMKFVLDAINDTTMAGANEACLACHTMIAVKMNWTHARSLEFDIGIGDPMTTETGVHNWTMSGWDVNGTASATVWGNTTGAGNTSYWSEWPGNVDDIYN